nr:CBS domain-containing protein [Nitrospirota bacterium]
DRDIVVRVTASGQDARSVLVGAVMSKPLVTITKRQDIGTAVGVMVRHGIRQLPIVDETGCLASILTLDDILRFKLADPAELTQIVRDRPQPLPPEPGANPLAPAMPAQEASKTFDTGLDFKPAVSSSDAGTATSSARPVASLTRTTKVVTMVRRRRRRTMLEEARYLIFANKTWVAVLLALAGLLILVSFFLAYFGDRFDSYSQSRYEPKDEERRVYMEERQRLHGGKVPSR